MIATLVLYVVLLIPAELLAATYYIDDAGSDAAAGTSTSTPWLTWAHAFTNSACGDTLTVMDGTYTVATHGAPTLTKVCTAGTVYTVVAQNERQALVVGTGAAAVFQVLNSAYVSIYGLRLKEVDLNGGTNHGVLLINTSTHVTAQRMLIYENNRYLNSHLVHVRFSTYSLLEDFELYTFHRHGIIVENYGVTEAESSGYNTIRRIYCNGRGRADIAGGFVSGGVGGDLCVALYPSSDNVVENVVAESVVTILSTEPLSGPADRNQILGSIALGTRTYGVNSYYGVTTRARGTIDYYQSKHNVIKDMIAINLGDTTLGGGVGIDSKSAFDTQVTNATVINPLNTGISASKDGSPDFTGGGVYSFYCTNCLVTDADSPGTGFGISSEVQTWTLNYVHAYNNVLNYNPANTDANITNEYTPLNTNPALGTCRAWIPDASPMKGAGLNGADIGANILYRYENAVLTNTPLWDVTTGAFPCGATVAGVNDTAGNSCNNVHERLNINMNGCLFPSGYGQQGGGGGGGTGALGRGAKGLGLF